jgi:hypothetical protein
MLEHFLSFGDTIVPQAQGIVKLHKDFGIDCATCLYQNFTSKFVQLAQTQNSARRGRQRAAGLRRKCLYEKCTKI